MATCKGINHSNQKLCTRIVKEGEYCWQHRDQFTIKPEKKKYKTRVQHQIDNTKVELGDLEEQIKVLDKMLLTENDPDQIQEMAVEMMKEKMRMKKMSEYISELEDKKKDPFYNKKKVPEYVKKSKLGRYVPEPSEQQTQKMSTYELKKFQSQQQKFKYQQSKKKTMSVKELQERLVKEKD